MKLRLLIIAALGVALALYLVFFIGVGAVMSAAVAIGWGGFAILCAYGLALFAVLGLAWYLPDLNAEKFWVFMRARMVRDAATEVLPFAQLGGLVFGARAAAARAGAATAAVAANFGAMYRAAARVALSSAYILSPGSRAPSAPG